MKISLILILVCVSILATSEGRWRGWGRDNGWSRRHSWKRWLNPARWIGSGRVNWRTRDDPFQFRFGLDFDDDDDDDNDDDDFNFIDWNEPLKWWTGPNVCVHRSERNETTTDEDGKDNGHHFSVTSTVCDKTETTYTCNKTVQVFGIRKTFSVIHECCHGYARETGKNGCTKKIELTDLFKTMQHLELTALVKALNASGLQDVLRESNYTVFAPNDDAMLKFLKKQEKIVLPETSVILIDGTISDQLVTDIKNTLLGHVVPGYLRSRELSDESSLTTANSETIRFNTYRDILTESKVVTANCARITSEDYPATNGIVHKINRVIEPVTQSIVDIVASDPQFSTLKTLLGRVGLVKLLNGKGSFTVFAPTNAAFSKLNESTLSNIQRTDSCLTNVLKNHVVQNTLCAAGLEYMPCFNTELGEVINVKFDDGKLFIGPAQVENGDVMATNGVIHVIDEVLVPQQGMDAIDSAANLGATDIAKVIDDAGLTSTIQALEHFTFFAPTNEAVQEFAKNLPRDPNYIKNVLLYHVVRPKVNSHDLKDGQSLETLYTPYGVTVRERPNKWFWSTEKMVQCATIKVADYKSCGGLVHLIDKVMVPATGDVVSTLSSDGRFSTLVNLIEKSGLRERLADGEFTMFAPTNEAFANLNDEDLKEITKDSDAIQKTLKNHILLSVQCCSFCGEYSTMQGPKLRLSRHKRVSLRGKRQEASITDCNVMATNGVIHAIDEVLVNIPRSHVRPAFEDLFNWWKQ